MLTMIRRLLRRPARHQREQEAQALKDDLMKNASETEAVLKTLNEVLEQSAAYRIAKAAGRHV